MEKVLAKSIHRIQGHSLHIFSRQQSGSHDNKYVKVFLRKTCLGKYLMIEAQWDGQVNLSQALRVEIVDWLETNREHVLQRIKEMG